MPSSQNPDSFDADRLAHLKLAMQIIGGRWRMVIICHLLEGPKRYTDLEKDIGIAKRMLSVNLRSLEELGFVTRTAYAQIPPRVEYSLTPKGKEVRSVICTLIDFGRKFKETHDPAAKVMSWRDAEPQ